MPQLQREYLKIDYVKSVTYGRWRVGAWTTTSKCQQLNYASDNTIFIDDINIAPVYAFNVPSNLAISSNLPTYGTVTLTAAGEIYSDEIVYDT